MSGTCRECVFWEPGPGMKPEGWGQCTRLSGEHCVTLLADADGEQIQHVRTPPSFGCNSIEYALREMETIEIYCAICEATVEHSLDAGMPQAAEELAEAHLMEHRESQARGEER